MLDLEDAIESRQRIAKIVDRVEGIATLPDVTAKIISTVNNPKSTAQDLHRIISHDPALVTRILQVVNSAFYARENKIDSVERAIVLLGFDAIHNLSIAASIGKLFSGKICDDYTAKDLWTHCIGVGVVARELCKLYRRQLADLAFLCGIVHDVGLLVSMQNFGDKLKRVCDLARDQQAPFCVLEQEIIGVDHMELGEALAAKWKFPEACRAVARYHHHPSMLDGELRQLVAILHVADALCCHNRVGFPLTHGNAPMDEAGIAGHVPLPIIQQMDERVINVVWTAVSIFR